MVLADRPSAPQAELLPGPVGERNLYRTMPRGDVLLVPASRAGLEAMLAALTATGNPAVIDTSIVGALTARELAPAARKVTGLGDAARFEGVIVEGDASRQAALAGEIAALPGRIIPVQDAGRINRDMLVHEISLSVNTAAAGGNASLMTLEDT
jgi:RHH-type proline utilization regulon transcriptional repressor/proline dehydrogenase/delta 1-pyrroline-5-carboxylate dehydrogenase